MELINILQENSNLFLFLIASALLGMVASSLLIIISQEKAWRWGEKLDNKRRPVMNAVHNILEGEWGLGLSGSFIFGHNLFLGSFLCCTIGGVILIWPPIWLFFTGFLTVLVLNRYQERFKLLSIIVIIFEFGAYIIAAVGGIRIGLAIFGENNLMTAINEWAILFSLGVIPIQIIQGYSEALLFHRIFVIDNVPWPHQINKEQKQSPNE